MTTKTKTHEGYYDALIRFSDEYAEETGNYLCTTHELAVWAVRTGRWEPPPDLVFRRCREDFAKAFREHYIDADGVGPVRARHVARIVQGDQQRHFWADIRKAPHEHMEVAFQQRRQQIVGDCRQLNRDVKYYGDIHPDRPQIQMLFDFRDDVEEGEASTEYPPTKPR